jgi:hypothetical protein
MHLACFPCNGSHSAQINSVYRTGFRRRVGVLNAKWSTHFIGEISSKKGCFSPCVRELVVLIPMSRGSEGYGALPRYFQVLKMHTSLDTGVCTANGRDSRVGSCSPMRAGVRYGPISHSFPDSDRHTLRCELTLTVTLALF